jgi:membrane associated rhomboid family serine protease
MPANPVTDDSIFRQGGRSTSSNRSPVAAVSLAFFQFAGYAAAAFPAATIHFNLAPDAIFRSGQVWRLLTGPFLPSEFAWTPAVFNAAAVFMFGWHLERSQGKLRLVMLYFGGSIFAALLWSIAALVWNWHRPLFSPVGPTALAVGVLMPGLRRPFPAFLPWRVPVWVAFVAYVAAWPTIVYAGAIDLSAHFLAGLFAVLFSQLSRSNRSDRTRAHGSAVKTTSPAPSDATELLGSLAGASSEQDPEFDRRVDELLKKITEAGYDSLSEDEIALLLEASQRYRNRPPHKPTLGAP